MMDSEPIISELKTCRTCKNALRASFIDKNYENIHIEDWGRCNTIRSIPSIEYLQENKETLKKPAYIIQSEEFNDAGFLFADLHFKIDEFGCLLHKKRD